MTALCGWLGSKSAVDNAPTTLQRMVDVLEKKHPLQAKQTANNWAVGLAATAKANCTLHSENGLTVALLGQPRYANKSAVEIASAFTKQFAEKREAAFTSLHGAFTALVIDESKQSISIAIDRMGIHSLSFVVTNGTLLFATSCDVINAHPSAQPEIDPQALYYYLYFHMIPAPGSIYRHYRRLLPGEYLTFSNGNLSTKPYWSMHFEENYQASFTELKNEFISTLSAAVKDAATGAPTGCFLSGGTDSSTMAGLLGKVTNAPARSYSIGFDEPGYDEMDYARIAAKHFGTDHHEYYVTPSDIVEAIPLIARGYDQPFGNSSAVPTYYCARMAKQDGIERLIGGDGGDELFGGNERYAKQRVFSFYEKIPSPLRNGLVTPLINNFPGNEQVTLLRKAKSYVQQASIPMPARLESYNLLERIGYENMFSPAFLRLIDTKKPVQHLDGIYHAADAKTQINRMLALDFRITLADNDLPKVIGACSLAGMEVTFPMLADSVVDFSAKLAPDLKLKGTKLRYFFKEALRDFLPNEIITKQKHGFGLPFGPWMVRHKPLQDLVVHNLHALQRRGFIKPAFINELTSHHLSTHSGYYGTMVWVLAMLEQWLSEHAPHYQLESA